MVQTAEHAAAVAMMSPGAAEPEQSRVAMLCYDAAEADYLAMAFA